MATRYPLVLLNAQQHMRRFAAIRDEYWAMLRSLLGPACVLVKLAAR
jgi:hypothetical protein